MKYRHNQTKEEFEDHMEIEKLYQERVKLITDIRQMCHLTLTEASVITELDISSLSRYERNNRSLPTDKFIQICYYFDKYIQSHGIPVSPKVKEEIKNMRIFSFV